MKKIALLASLSSIILATSCQKDEESAKKNDLIGTWTIKYGGEDKN